MAFSVDTYTCTRKNCKQTLNAAMFMFKGKLLRQLNKLGAVGWELCTVTNNKEKVYFCFKRQIEELMPLAIMD